MNKTIRVLTMLSLLLPLLPAEGRMCDMMKAYAGSPEAGQPAKSDACCAAGACDCGIKAAPSRNAASPQINQNFSPGNKHVHPVAHEASALSAQPACGCRTAHLVSTPAPPDKPYQLTSQYRI